MAYIGVLVGSGSNTALRVSRSYQECILQFGILRKSLASLLVLIFLIVILITHDIYHSWIVNIQLAAVLVLPDKAHYF